MKILKKIKNIFMKNKLLFIPIAIVFVVIFSGIMMLINSSKGISAQSLVDSNFTSNRLATHSKIYVELKTSTATSNINIDNTRSNITDHIFMNDNEYEIYVTKIDKKLGVYSKKYNSKKWRLEYKTPNVSEDDSRTGYIEKDNEKNITDINIKDISDIEFSQEKPEDNSDNDEKGNYIVSGKISYITTLALLGNNKQALLFNNNYNDVSNVLTSVGANIKMNALMVFDKDTENLIYIELTSIDETLKESIDKYYESHPFVTSLPEKMTIRIYNDSFEEKEVFVPTEVDLNSVKVE